MEKRYYLVEKEGGKGRAFIVGLENKLKHIAGDRSITKIMEFKEGVLNAKDSESKYNIFCLNEFQFEVSKEQYYKLKAENN